MACPCRPPTKRKNSGLTRDSLICTTRVRSTACSRTYTLEAVWALQEVQGLSVVGPLTGHALVSPRAYQARHPFGGALRVEVSLTKRVLVLYQDNKIALISHVSTGGGYYYCSPDGCGYAITPTGRFRTTVYMPGWVTVPLRAMQPGRLSRRRVSGHRAPVSPCSRRTTPGRRRAHPARRTPGAARRARRPVLVSG
jgi:hypothetical protein